MGATIVAVWCTNELISVAHVGDSRIYRLRAGNFEQLTQDHSFVAEEVRHGKMTAEEAATSTMQNVLVRALGIEPAVEVDVSEELLTQGDSVLLCSDGLTRMVTDPEIASTLLTSTSAQESADRLVDLANDNGGVDNVTVIVLQVVQKSESVFDRLKIWKKYSG